MSRRVQVDDADSGFRYSSGWSAIPGDQYNNQGNFGSTYLNTLHSATTAASFTYAFNGADGAVLGTTNISKNSAGVIDPTWECLVDGNPIPLKNPFPFTENNWVLCSWDSSIVPFGQHTLTVNVKSAGRAFLFDYFTYIPSPNANVNNAGISLACTDSALQYGAGWKLYGDNLGRMAPAGGAPVSLSFYGTGIMWYGTAPTELPHGNSIAFYSIDGQPSTTFTVPGTPSQLTQYVRFYFQTPALPLGHHTIVVTSGGLTSQTPMVLSNIIIQGGSVQEPPPPNTAAPPVVPTTAQPGAGLQTTALPPTASGVTTNIVVSNGLTITQTQLLPLSISTTPGASASANITGITNTGQPTSASDNAALPTGSTSSDSSNAGGAKSAAVKGSGTGTSVGAIVGGILGALLLIAIVVLLVVFWRRRKTRQQKALEKVQVQQPFYSDMVQSQSAFNVVQPGEASSSPGESIFHDVHTYHPPHGGNVGGAFNKSRPPDNTNFSNLLSDITPSTPGFSHYQISSNATSYSQGPESTAGSEATLPSAHGSVAPLLPSERASSKYAEHLAESSSQAYTAYYTPESSTNHDRVVNHEDSGYRARSAGPSRALPGGILEFPPAYTTS
ncbi:hypothetical protein D9619_006745 [Psilocybe cf. subviscida]|uniref:Uncharacterized protein n=1 Tax=Psilocybe cf. subviscida TaxID=2480587 RepID=A0A8H5B5Q9_9AGAR|nr:hypothetical protein D9619_006745 [Psilocybe cf. subviscida]